MEIMVNSTNSSRIHDVACLKKRKGDLFSFDCEVKCHLTHGDVKKKPHIGTSANVCFPGPVQGSTASEVKQLGPSVREWDRAVGLRLENAVVLAAHRLTFMNEVTGYKDKTLVCAMTGEVPVSAAESALQALTEEIKDLEQQGKPRLTVEEAAEFVPQFSRKTKNEHFIEFLVAGRDWDKLGEDFVPCLSYANKRSSWNPETSFCTGLGAIYSQSIVDNLFKENMSKEEAEDVALHAIYVAADCQKVKGQAVLEAVDVCVITADGITTRTHTVEYLHRKYGPELEKMYEEIRRYSDVVSRWCTVPIIPEGEKGVMYE